jgi:hypothetical protein
MSHTRLAQAAAARNLQAFEQHAGEADDRLRRRRRGGPLA